MCSQCNETKQKERSALHPSTLQHKNKFYVLRAESTLTFYCTASSLSLWCVQAERVCVYGTKMSARYSKKTCCVSVYVCLMSVHCVRAAVWWRVNQRAKLPAAADVCCFDSVQGFILCWNDLLPHCLTLSFIVYISFFQLFIKPIWCLYCVTHSNSRLHVFYGCTFPSNWNIDVLWIINTFAQNSTWHIWYLWKCWHLHQNLKQRRFLPAGLWGLIMELATVQ